MSGGCVAVSGLACIMAISGDMGIECGSFARCPPLLVALLGESGLACCFRPLLACTLSTHVSCLPVRTHRMHGRCWSQRALAFLQLEQARTTRVPPAASLSSARLLSSPLCSGASDVGSAEGESDAVRDGEDEAVSDGEDWGEEARLDTSVLPSGGEDEMWCAAVGEVASGEEDEEGEAEEAAEEEDDEADGETVVEAVRDGGCSALCSSARTCSCTTLCSGSDASIARTLSGEGESGRTEAAAAQGREEGSSNSTAYPRNRHASCAAYRRPAC